LLARAAKKFRKRRQEFANRHISCRYGDCYLGDLELREIFFMLLGGGLVLLGREWDWIEKNLAILLRYEKNAPK
jgi:hypothetical protein